MKAKIALIYTLSSIGLYSCATIQNLKEEIYLQSLNIDLIQDKEFYIRALHRWPDITDGSQLQRRVLILSSHPSKKDLKKLDESRDEQNRIRNPKKNGPKKTSGKLKRQGPRPTQQLKFTLEQSFLRAADFLAGAAAIPRGARNVRIARDECPVENWPKARWH